jgi:hypothetical protein
MSVFETMFEPESDQEKAQGRFIDKALSTYYKWKMADRVLDAGLDKLGGPSLDEVEKRLSIRTKKKALGLPYDDDDYETATNEGLSFSQKGAVAAFGKHIADRVPAPDFLNPSKARGLMETSFPKTASGAFGALLSSGISTAGGKYGRGISGIAKFFGRR